MKNRFEIVETTDRDNIPGPSPRNSAMSKKYKGLVRAIASLPSGEALKVKVETLAVGQYLRKVVARNFTHTKYQVTQRTEFDDKGNKEFYVYIFREEG